MCDKAKLVYLEPNKTVNYPFLSDLCLLIYPDIFSVFYKMGNFPSAVNAYSEAIKISPSLAKLYINRASCYIVLNLFEDAVVDCTRALDLLVPPVEANRMSRVRTLAKRGSAYCQIQLIDNGMYISKRSFSKSSSL